jgi:hypothetical protein
MSTLEWDRARRQEDGAMTLMVGQNGWVEHEGSLCPFTDGSVIELVLRNGQRRGPGRVQLYGGWRWFVGAADGFNILFYRVVPQVLG